MLSTVVLSVVALTAPGSVSAAAYSLTQNFSGSTFFDKWNYYGHYDNLTNGDAIFVNKSAAADLTYINSAGNAIIKVDNTSVVPYNEKRNTVRLQSQDSYGIGSLWVMDAVHVPYGCSVWPAWWSQAPDWPAGGEIDTFEGSFDPCSRDAAKRNADSRMLFSAATGVNLQTTNQYALHTESGCEATGTSANELGNLTYADCSSTANDNSGCTVLEPNTASYGEAFAAAGGGVYATELASTGISIWFFSRANIPSDLLASNTSAVPDPSGWGTPSAYYPTSGCSMDKFFAGQHLVLDITLCGDWAGSAAVFNATCSGVCYTDYVLKADSYNTAYFEIPSIRVYSSNSSSSSSSTSKSAASVARSFGTSSSVVLAVGATILTGAMALL
ncbi:hypothetical protein RQP46_008341 [Phenoliferia psychrophenolica]